LLLPIILTLHKQLYGVEENYLDETYTQFYRPTEESSQFKYSSTPDGKPDTIKSLFTDAGKGMVNASIIVISLALLPQEKNGIIVPPEIASAPDPSADNSSQLMSTEKAYKEYLDVIISESLVRRNEYSYTHFFSATQQVLMSKPL
jgi:hypothetical protein